MVTSATTNNVINMNQTNDDDDDDIEVASNDGGGYCCCCEVEDMGYNLLMEAKEYRFVSNPPTNLKTIINLCENKHHQLDEFDADDEVLFWFSSQSCFGRRSTNFSSNEYLISEGYYCISLVLQTSFKRYPLEIYGKTSEAAVDCLIFLLQLPDDNDDYDNDNDNVPFIVDKVTIIPKGIGNYNFNPIKCPICPSNLQKVLIADGSAASAVDKEFGSTTTTIISQRQYKFQRIIFTAEQAYVMATTGTKTNLWFRLCQFEDDGESFVDAFQNNGHHDDDFQEEEQREGGSTVGADAGATATTTSATIGPAKLTFDGYPRQPPFIKIHWLRFFKLANIDLCLRYVCFDRDCSKALANGNLKGLSLVDCTFADEGEALVESIQRANINTTATTACRGGTEAKQQSHHQQQMRRRRGPRSLEIEADTFQRLDIWEQFMVEIGHPNCCLESLGISNGGRSTNIIGTNGEIYDNVMFTQRFMELLSHALTTNTALKELSCYIPHHSSCKKSLHKLCTAVGKHPNLLKIDIRPDINNNNNGAFGGGGINNNNNNFEDMYQQRIEYTDLIATLVEENPNLEDVQYYEEVFDTVIWQTRIVPRLAYNRYNKLFTKYRSYRLIDPTLAIALDNVATKESKDIAPSLVWMLLSDHCEKLAV